MGSSGLANSGLKSDPTPRIVLSTRPAGLGEMHFITFLITTTAFHSLMSQVEMFLGYLNN